jgi:hypothetical protein
LYEVGFTSLEISKYLTEVMGKEYVVNILNISINKIPNTNSLIGFATIYVEGVSVSYPFYFWRIKLCDIWSYNCKKKTHGFMMPLQIQKIVL